MKRILIFSGTTEGNEAARMLSGYPVRVYLSVATDYGRICAEKHENVEVVAGRKNRQEIETFIRSRRISLVIDATHPFAQLVTENVKAACASCKVAYIRCLRDALQSGRAPAVEVESVREAVKFLQGTEGNILITTGSKELKEYTAILDYKNRCYARVLPAARAVLESCALWFEGRHLIAMQGPFSKEMNTALLNYTGARYFVAKESGKAGGFPEKLEAAAQTGAVLVAVARPKEDGMTLPQLQAYLEKNLRLPYRI